VVSFFIFWGKELVREPSVLIKEVLGIVFFKKNKYRAKEPRKIPYDNPKSKAQQKSICFVKIYKFLNSRVSEHPRGTGQKSALSSFVLHLSYRSAFFGRKDEGNKQVWTQ
jgi:hypothetical protein